MVKVIQHIYSILVIGLVLVSCTNEGVLDKVDNTTEMVETATDYIAAETAFEDALDLVDEEGKQQEDLNQFVGEVEADYRGCATVTIARPAPGAFPITMSLDFGESCVLDDGRIVSGRMMATYTGKIRDAGTSYTLTFVDFTINGKMLKGSKTVTNNGLNANDQLSYTTVVTDGVVEFTNGNVVTYESTRTRTWIAGMDTNFEDDGIEGLQDDVWEITGSASGKNRSDNAYQVEITSPILRAVNCRWLTAGILELDADIVDNTVVVDYGDGTCDDQAAVTVGLIQRNITMN